MKISYVQGAKGHVRRRAEGLPRYVLALCLALLATVCSQASPKNQREFLLGLPLLPIGVKTMHIS